MNATKGLLVTTVLTERCLIGDEGRSLAVGVQAQAANHLKLRR